MDENKGKIIQWLKVIFENGVTTSYKTMKL